MRLRVRGVFLLVIILVVACAFTGVMIWKWRYEDSKAQADVNQLVQMDAGTTSLAIQALPLVMQYDKLSKVNPKGCPQMDTIASQIVAIFPDFREPSAGPGIKLVPTIKMLYLLRYWMRNQAVSIPAKP